MPHWLVKSDPDEYSAADLERDGRTAWTGVSNALACRHLREMRAGDQVLVYHTGKAKAIVARARVESPADAADGKPGAVVLAFAGWLTAPVSLATIKSDAAFAELAIVRIGRLSVMPVSTPQWKRILALGKAAAKSP
ncbi:EVE domain protein [Phycisphaerae bacterium RAS1]|nr:EVE domain protein [Phycisphaerae bacterium RAS1]